MSVNFLSPHSLSLLLAASITPQKIHPPKTHPSAQSFTSQNPNHQPSNHQPPDHPLESVTATGSCTITANPDGGYTLQIQGTTRGSDGSARTGQIEIQTDSQGQITYSSSSTDIDRKGQRSVITTEGNGSYDPLAGYRVQEHIEVNGQSCRATSVHEHLHPFLG